MLCRTAIPGPSRRGSIQPLLIVTILILMLLFAVAVDFLRLWTVRTELQNNADATALDIARFLVGDDFLRASLGNDPSALPTLLSQARQEAITFAGVNRVNARQFQLLDNPTNQPDGEIVFGILDTPRSTTLMLPGDVSDANNKQLLAVNTILVHERLTRSRANAPGLLFPQLTGIKAADTQVRAAAMLDRDVVGFRPVVSQALPVAPLAFLADYGQANANSWQYQVEVKGNWVDQYQYNTTTGMFDMAAGDGLPEFAATIALDAARTDQANVALAFVGINNGDFAAQDAQLLSGLSAAQLQTFGAPYQLDATSNMLTVPGTLTGPAAPSDQNDLYNTLTMLRDQAAIRVWPLYCNTDGTGHVSVCGFVAGRVAAVESPAGGLLHFTVQPTMLAVNAAVTNALQRGKNNVPVVNPYICKVRLVE